jgi:hypothetical protein
MPHPEKKMSIPTATLDISVEYKGQPLNNTTIWPNHRQHACPDHCRGADQMIQTPLRESYRQGPIVRSPVQARQPGRRGRMDIPILLFASAGPTCTCAPSCLP